MQCSIYFVFQLRCTVKLKFPVLVILSFQNRGFCPYSPLNNNVILSDPPLPGVGGGGERSQWIWILFYTYSKKSHTYPRPHPQHTLTYPATSCKKNIYKNVAHSQCEEKLPVGRSLYKSPVEVKGVPTTCLRRLAAVLTLEVYILTVEILSSASSVCVTQPASAVPFCQGEWKLWN